MGTGPNFSLPVGITPASGQQFPTTRVGFLDAGTAGYDGTMEFSGTTIIPYVLGNAGSFSVFSQITATSPMTWTTNDKLAINITFEAV